MKTYLHKRGATCSPNPYLEGQEDLVSGFITMWVIGVINLPMLLSPSDP